MYIWIGCELPEAFENALRQKCLQENEGLGLDTAAFSLPQHISLKISFETERAGEVLSFLQDFLAAQPSFSVALERIEQIPGILWLCAARNPVLENLHRALDEALLHRFGIPRHPFDRTFLFHSTLFLDENGEKLAQMARAMADFPLPAHLQIDRFLLGTSPDGKAGTYRVVARVPTKTG